jgi:hypothetical protein
VRGGSGFGWARAHKNPRYLTFDDPSHISLDTYVFNTEGGRLLLCGCAYADHMYISSSLPTGAMRTTVLK